MSDLLISE